MVHRQLWASGVCPLSSLLFYCPNVGNDIEDISTLQKGRYAHECKKAKSGDPGKEEKTHGELAAVSKAASDFPKSLSGGTSDRDSP